MSKRPAEMDGTEGNDAKRPKMEEETPASKVLHVRNLPQDVTEQELIAMGTTFGAVNACLILQHKGQGFLEMESVASATALIQYFETNPAQIRNRTAYFQFSRRSEILSKARTSTPNRILLVTVENVQYPVTLDTIHTVFQSYGRVEKIVLVNKSGFQALVQFSDIPSATAAKNAIDGQNIYTGCCTLKIQFSNLTDGLTVKTNSDKSRDFTNPNLPTAAPTMYGQQAFGYGQMGMPGMPGMGMGMGMGMDQGGAVIVVNNLGAEGTPDILFMLFGTCGDVLRVKILFNKRSTALIQLADHAQAQQCVSQLNGCPLYGQTLAVSMSKHASVSPPSERDLELGLTKDYTGSPLHRFSGRNNPPVAGPSDTLHLANLAPEVDEEAVRESFSAFGTVEAFRHFHNDNKMGVVKMSTVEEAVYALIALHNSQLKGRTLKVSFSKSGYR